jgi:Cys-tRNA(Pro) deacylase
MDQQPLSVDDVRAYLRPHRIDVLEIPADTSTAALAAEALGTTVDTIVKSLVFWAGDEPILVLVAGNRKLNARRLARDLGLDKVRLARPEEVVAVAGYPVGGVPPVAHRRRLRTLIDRHLLEPATVYAAAGSSNAIFPISPQRLLELTAGELTDAAE